MTGSNRRARVASTRVLTSRYSARRRGRVKSSSAVPDIAPIGRNSRTEQRIILCPSWWGPRRRDRWAEDYVDDDAQQHKHPDTDPSFARSSLTEDAPTVIPMSDALCRIEPALRPISFLLHIAGDFAGLTPLTVGADKAMTDLVPLGDGQSFMDPLITVVRDEIEAAVDTGRVPSSRERDMIGSEGVEVLVVTTNTSATAASRGPELVNYALKKLNEASIPALRIGVEEIEISARMAGMLSRSAQGRVDQKKKRNSAPPEGARQAASVSHSRRVQPHSRLRHGVAKGALRRGAMMTRVTRRDYRPGGFLLRHRNALAVTMCTLVLVTTGLIVAVRSGGSHDSSNHAGGSARSAETPVAGGKDVTGSHATLSAKNRRGRPGQSGGIVDNGVVRAALTAGWVRSASSTPERLILENPADRDVRILVSGHLVEPDVNDEHLRGHVESMVSTRSEFSNYAPQSAWRQGAVSYEERPEGGSVVQWTTFLQEGKQVSVGCQWKGELNAKRTAACSAAARSAEVMPS